MNDMRIGDLLELQRGYDLTHHDMKVGNVPVVGSNGIIGYHNKSNVSSPCLVIGRSGTVGIPHLYEMDCWAHNTTLFVKDFKGNNPYYLYYLLKNIHIDKVASSTGVPTLNRNFVYPLTIKAEKDILKQERIASMLKNIDSKIAVNNKINAELEETAKTLYDYWFTQFDFPDENGKPYKSSGGKMVYSETLHREIPVGWEVANIKDFCDITWGQCPDGKNILPLNTELENTLLYCSGAGDMRGGLLVDCQARTNASRRLAHKNDILMSVAGSIGAIAICDKTISLGRAAVAFTPKDNTILFVYSVIKMFVNRMKSVSSGSIQKVINDSHLDDINFAYSEDMLTKFSKYNVILEKQILLSKENQELAKLRDWLLPMLMNGQATVE